MGTCYYLAREDNGTLYDVGKVSGWRESLGNGEPFVFPSTDDEMVSIAERLDAGWHDGWAPAMERSYFADIAYDMRKWSDGHPVRFVSEHHGLIERWEDDDVSVEAAGGENRTTLFLQRITGNRYRDDDLRACAAAKEKP